MVLGRGDIEICTDGARAGMRRMVFLSYCVNDRQAKWSNPLSVRSAMQMSVLLSVLRRVNRSCCTWPLGAGLRGEGVGDAKHVRGGEAFGGLKTGRERLVSRETGRVRR